MQFQFTKMTDLVHIQFAMTAPPASFTHEQSAIPRAASNIVLILHLQVLLGASVIQEVLWIEAGSGRWDLSKGEDMILPSAWLPASGSALQLLPAFSDQYQTSAVPLLSWTSLSLRNSSINSVFHLSMRTASF